MGDRFVDVETGDIYEKVGSDSVYYEPSPPKRTHGRKVLFVFLLVFSLMTVTSYFVMSFMNATEGNLTVFLIANLPILVVGVLLTAICLLVLGAIAKVTNVINDANLDELDDVNGQFGTIQNEYIPDQMGAPQNLTNKYNLGSGENISLDNYVPMVVLKHLQTNSDDICIKQAIAKSLEVADDNLHGVVVPEQEWLAYRADYIKKMGKKYHGSGIVKGQDGKNLSFARGVIVKWTDDERGYPVFEYYGGFEGRQIDLVVNNYVDLRFCKLFALLRALAWLVYPLLALSIVLSILPRTEFVQAVLVSFVILGLISIAFCFYKNYAGYKKYDVSGRSAVIKMVIFAWIALAFGLGIASIVSGENVDILMTQTLLSAVLFDLICLVDIAIQKSEAKFRLQNSSTFKVPTHWGAIILTGVILAFVLTVVVLLLSVSVPTIRDAIIAYDEGLTDDLSIPLTFWGISLAVSLAIIAVAGFAVNKLLQAKDIAKRQAQNNGTYNG